MEMSGIGVPVPASAKTRIKFDGKHSRFRPSAHCHLRSTDHPFKWFQLVYSEKMMKGHVKCSNKYIKYCRKGGIKSYPKVREGWMNMKRVAHLACVYLLNGLDPVPSQEHLHKRSFAFKGHRVADIFSQAELKAVRCFFHLSDPFDKEGGSSDNLFKVRKDLEEMKDMLI